MPDTYRELYELLNKSVYTQCESIDITDSLSSCANGPDTVNMIFRSILDEHPEYFWFEGKWGISVTDGRVIIRPVYGFDRNNRTIFEKRIEKRAEEITDAVTDEIRAARDTADGCMQDKELLIRAVYDWVLDHVIYSRGRREGQTVYDALIDGEAVCKGLSKTMQLLLGRLGIKISLRTGSIDGISRHVWNSVEINGKKYNIDVSMGYGSFDYLYQGSCADRRERAFLVSDEELKVLL